MADFVERGKVDFRSLVTSMIADLARRAARQFVFEPIAGAPGSLFPAAPLVAPLPVPRPVAHARGVAGRIPATRLVPNAAFLGAQRLHAGGAAGLRSDEVPTIPLRGGRVLSRAESRDDGRPMVVNITMPDAESFRRARTQVASPEANQMGNAGLDLHSRRVIGWAVSDRLKGDLAIRALGMAIDPRRPPKGCITPIGDRGIALTSTGRSRAIRVFRFR